MIIIVFTIISIIIWILGQTISFFLINKYIFYSNTIVVLIKSSRLTATRKTLSQWSSTKSRRMNSSVLDPARAKLTTQSNQSLIIKRDILISDPSIAVKSTLLPRLNTVISRYSKFDKSWHMSCQIVRSRPSVWQRLTRPQ